MTERQINIVLTPEIVKDYYFSSDFYSTNIKKFDFRFLVVFIVALSALTIFSILSFDKFIFLILMLLVLSVYSAYQFLSYLIRRWRWLELVKKISTRYKDIGIINFTVNNQGLGFSYNGESDLHLWARIKSFKINKSYLTITYNDEDFTILPLINVDKETLDLIIAKLNAHGSINEELN